MILALSLLACRPELGVPKYPNLDPWVDDVADGYENPLQEGEERLSYGIFNEGPATESLVVDGVENHFYIYESTFSLAITDDRWEGYVADTVVNSGVGWWGGGVHWDVPRDIRDWDALHLVARSDVLADWEVAILGGGVEARVPVAEVGFVADGDWHVMEVPLSSFEALGADLSTVTVGMLFGGEGGVAGDEVVIDGLYLTRGLP